jgi:hypothetical protein
MIKYNNNDNKNICMYNCETRSPWTAKGAKGLSDGKSSKYGVRCLTSNSSFATFKPGYPRQLVI